MLTEEPTMLEEPMMTREPMFTHLLCELGPHKAWLGMPSTHANYVAQMPIDVHVHARPVVEAAV